MQPASYFQECEGGAKQGVCKMHREYLPGAKFKGFPKTAPRVAHADERKIYRCAALRPYFLHLPAT